MSKSEASILVFIGSDEGRVQEEAHKAFQKLSPPGADEFSNDIIDGRAENAEHALRLIQETAMAVQTHPFFGGGKVVWLKACNFLDDSVTGRAESVKEAVEHFVSVLTGGMPEGNTFVLSASPVDKRRGVFKTLAKLGKVETLDKAETSRAGWEGNLVPWVAKRAVSLGLKPARGAIDTLVGLVGAETRRLDSELEKLRTYAGSDVEVTSDDVRAVVSPSATGVLWDLGNAIGRRDLPGALARLDQLLGDGESAVGLIRAAIIPRVRALFLAMEIKALLKGRDVGSYPAFKTIMANMPAEDVEHLPRNKSGELSLYPIYNALSESRKFTRDEILDALDSCLDADYKLVYTSHPPPLVLSQLLTRILGPRAVAATA